MNKVLVICFLLLVIVSPIAAQDPEWQLNFFEDFNDNAFAWPLGTEMQGETTVSRSIREGSYVWNIPRPTPMFPGWD